MVKRWSWLLLLGLVSSSLAAETTLRVSRSVQLAAEPEQVWAKVGKFEDLSWYPQAVVKTELLAGDAKTPGAKRRITLKDGGTLTETLSYYNDKGRGYSYTLDEGSLPVSSYKASLMVRKLGKGSTEVVWISRFRHKNAATGADAAADKVAKAAVEALYDGAIQALRQEFAVPK